MGNLSTKLFTHVEDNKLKLSTNIKLGVVEKQHQCTPIMTRKHLTADPRSATLGIVRTPIESAVTPAKENRRTASAIPKHLRTKQYLETDIDSVIPTLNKETQILDPRSPNVDCQRTPITVRPSQDYLTPIVQVIPPPSMDTPLTPGANALDPRSPATTFDRTPILKPKSAERLNVSQENSFENVSNQVSSSLPQIAYCETVSDFIPEIQVLPDIVSNQPPMLNKAYESWHTYDNEFNDSLGNKYSSEDSDSEHQVTIISNMKSLTTNDDDQPDAASPTAFDENLTNLFIKSKAEEEEEAKINDDLLQGDQDFPASVSKKLFTDADEKIRVWRDSISPELVQNEPKNDVFIKREDIMIEFDDNLVPQQPNQHPKMAENVGLKSDENVKHKIQNVNGKKKKTYQSKKDGKGIIFEDVKTFNADSMIIPNVCKNRTPLANRSNSHYKAEITAKSPQQLLRNKCLSTKSQQQENTPPRNKQNSKKLNYTHWDMDKTVVI